MRLKAKTDGDRKVDGERKKDGFKKSIYQGGPG
jgi:hypothetical protein